jgi:hypothetical protein
MCSIHSGCVSVPRRYFLSTIQGRVRGPLRIWRAHPSEPISQGTPGACNPKILALAEFTPGRRPVRAFPKRRIRLSVRKSAGPLLFRAHNGAPEVGSSLLRQTPEQPHPEEARSAVSKDGRTFLACGPSFETPPSAAPPDEDGARDAVGSTRLRARHKSQHATCCTATRAHELRFLVTKRPLFPGNKGCSRFRAGALVNLSRRTEERPPLIL